MEWIQHMDGEFLLWLRDTVSCGFLDSVMKAVSSLGNGGLLWIALGVVFLLMGIKNKKWRNRGLLLLLSLAANALVCNVLLKPMVGRIRPYDLLGYDIIIPPLSDPSFPSGHTSASFASSAAIYAMNRKWGIAAYAFSVVMGFSRLYLGVHFPTDVLTGAVIGFLMAKLVQRIWRKRKKEVSF